MQTYLTIGVMLAVLMVWREWGNPETNSLVLYGRFILVVCLWPLGILVALVELAAGRKP